MKRVFLIALCVVCSFLSSPHTTRAADFSITVSPSFLLMRTNPGEATSATVRIQNNGSQTQEISIGFLKIKPATSGDQLDLEHVDQTDPFLSWVTLDKEHLTITPGRSETIQLTINAPAEAALGYYYALSLQDVNTTVAGSDNTVVTGATAVPILLEVVVPQARRDIQIIDYSVSRSLYDYLPATFRITVKNTGNVHVAPRGNIFINKAKNKDATNAIATLDVNNDSAGGYILPGSTRVFTATFTDGFPHYNQPESSKDNRHLEWDFSHADTLRIGKYEGTLVLVYDSGSQDESVEGIVYFWIVPWQLIVGSIGVVIVLYNLKSVFQYIKRLRIAAWQRLKGTK